MWIEEAEWTEEVKNTMIRLSEDWESEKNCWGYRKNTWDDLKDEQVFLARSEKEILGYLLGHLETIERGYEAIPRGTRVFEVSELYVIPSERSKGIGKALMQTAKNYAEGKAEAIFLVTAPRNAHAIMHFYLDEVGMEMISAILFQRLS